MHKIGTCSDLKYVSGIPFYLIDVILRVDELFNQFSVNFTKIQLKMLKKLASFID